MQIFLCSCKMQKVITKIKLHNYINSNQPSTITVYILKYLINHDLDSENQASCIRSYMPYGVEGRA